MSSFLNNIKGKLDKGVATVGAHSKAAIEKSQINSAISNIEAERNNIYLNLGREIYNQWQETNELGQISDYLPLLDAAKAKGELLKVKQEELSRIEDERALVIGKTSAAEAEVEGILCTCGNKNSPANKFCMNCGNKLEA